MNMLKSIIHAIKHKCLRRFLMIQNKVTPIISEWLIDNEKVTLIIVIRRAKTGGICKILNIENDGSSECKSVFDDRKIICESSKLFDGKE